MSYEVYKQHEHLKTFDLMTRAELLAEAEKLTEAELRIYITMAYVARLQQAMMFPAVDDI